MSTSNQPLPEFDRPPVTEVALSVDFAALPAWTNSSALTYAKQIQSEFPDMEIRQLAGSQMERFGDDAIQMPQISITPAPNPNLNRFWYLANPANYLIQTQFDKFAANWRKLTAEDRYPRYLRSIRPFFETEWKRFRTFAGQQTGNEIAVKQCELVYVNDLV